MLKLKIDSNDTVSMPVWLLVATGLLLLVRVVATAIELANPAVPKQGIAWLDPKTPRDPNSTKPVLYLFTTDWSNACRELDNINLRDPEVIKMVNTNFTPVRVVDKSLDTGGNLPTVQNLEMKYSVTGFPNLMVVLPDGTYCDELQGQPRRDGVQRFLKTSLQDLNYYAGSEAFASCRFDIAEKRLGEYIDRPDRSPSWLRSAILRRYISLVCLGRKQEADECINNYLNALSEANLPLRYRLRDQVSRSWTNAAIKYFAGKGKLEQIKLNEHPEAHIYFALVAFAKNDQAECVRNIETVLSFPALRDYWESRAARSLLLKLPAAERDRLQKQFPP